VSERDLDVVVFGATGVTGRRVAAYLAERAAETDLRWAAAARDADKAGKLLGEIGVTAPQTIVADVGDGSSLAAMASRARVVLDLVGPYTLHGRPVVEACVAGGAHYVDLTGELPFVREIIADFHELAATAGVKIVQVCGFESLPPDLMITAAAERAREAWGEGLAAADLEVVITPPPGPPRISDGMSGGTFQSLAAVAASDEAALIDDPALLITDAEVAAAVRRVSPIELVPRSGSGGAVIAPMMPAPFINPAVIHRTAALLASAEGRPAEPFRYREGMALAGGGGSLAARWAIAGAMAGYRSGFEASRAHGRRCAGRSRARSRGSDRHPASAPPPIASRVGGGRCTCARARGATRSSRCASRQTGTRGISRRRGSWARRGCCSPRTGLLPNGRGA
jgi:hypothetical protein